MNSFVRKLKWWLHSPDKEADLRAELQFHLEEEAEQRQRDGLTPQEASFAALRKFGNVALIAEDARAQWIPVWLDQMCQELRYGLRTLRREWFTAGAATGDENTLRGVNLLSAGSI